VVAEVAKKDKTQGAEMHKTIKRIGIAVVAILMLAATPIFAELDGQWKGEGEGTWSPPSGIILNPWQSWEGRVKEGVFWGTWSDADGHTGGFHGSIIALSPTTASAQGTWTWYDITGITVVGPFEMSLNYVNETCKGWWSSFDAVSAKPLGKMWGVRVGD
jgi:hypothetical protein